MCRHFCRIFLVHRIADSSSPMHLPASPRTRVSHEDAEASFASIEDSNAKGAKTSESMSSCADHGCGDVSECGCSSPRHHDSRQEGVSTGNGYCPARRAPSVTGPGRAMKVNAKRALKNRVHTNGKQRTDMRISSTRCDRQDRRVQGLTQILFPERNESCTTCETLSCVGDASTEANFKSQSERAPSVRLSKILKADHRSKKFRWTDLPSWTKQTSRRALHSLMSDYTRCEMQGEVCSQACSLSRILGPAVRVWKECMKLRTVLDGFCAWRFWLDLYRKSRISR